MVDLEDVGYEFPPAIEMGFGYGRRRRYVPERTRRVEQVKSGPSTMYGASTAAIENTRKAGLMTEPQNFRCSCAPSAGRWWWKRRTGATDLWPGATDIWPGGDLPAGFI